MPKEYEIVELHMDAGQETARGGHVIIFSGFKADNYNKALANMLADILPGRSQLIVCRNNLANTERAAMREYGYRLVEFGFITNARDVEVFNGRMDDIARDVLDVQGMVVSNIICYYNMHLRSGKQYRQHVFIALAK